MPRRRSFGTVRKLESGRFQARYTDLNGKQQVAPETFATKTAALDWLAALQADRSRGHYLDPHAGTLLLRDYAESWVSGRMVKGRPLAPRTIELYRSYLAHHIDPTLGHFQLRQITTPMVRNWHTKLSGPDGPGASTTAKCYRLLRAIMNTALEDELIVRNPVAIRGAGQEPESHRPSFSLDQIDDLVAATDERWRAYFLLAGWTGLRFGELAALRREDLDLKTGEVHVRTAAVDVTGQARSYNRPKSDAGRRTVAIPPHVLPALRVHLLKYAQPGKRGLIFVGPKGGPLHRSNFNRRVWQPARDAAGLPATARPHDLRGYSATFAAQQGATVKELMHRLGHSSVAAAMKYQRAQAERDRALAAAMSAAATGHRTDKGRKDRDDGAENPA